MSGLCLPAHYFACRYGRAGYRFRRVEVQLHSPASYNRICFYGVSSIFYDPTYWLRFIGNATNMTAFVRWLIHWGL